MPVLDASVAVAWILEEQQPAANAMAAALGNAAIHVPALWRWEVLNSLRAAELSGRISSPDADDALRLVHPLDVTVDRRDALANFGAELALARRFSLSVYDAAYLELAIRIGSPLMTIDKQLAEAADTLGVLWRPA